MIDLSRNHFELFGLPARYAIDLGALDRAYRVLQSDVHPDRFAAAAESERRLASQGSARVNEAYRALKDPVERARYLLSLRGVDAFDETDTRLPVTFLEEQLERRERAAAAAEAQDLDALDAIVREVRDEFRDRERELAPLVDDPARTRDAKGLVRELRFLAKVAEDVDAMAAAIE